MVQSLLPHSLSFLVLSVNHALGIKRVQIGTGYGLRLVRILKGCLIHLYITALCIDIF